MNVNDITNPFHKKLLELFDFSNLYKEVYYCEEDVWIDNLLEDNSFEPWPSYTEEELDSLAAIHPAFKNYKEQSATWDDGKYRLWTWDLILIYADQEKIQFFISYARAIPASTITLSLDDKGEKIVISCVKKFVRVPNKGMKRIKDNEFFYYLIGKHEDSSLGTYIE